MTCISEVSKLGNSTRINERCLELQKNNKKEVSKIKVPKFLISFPLLKFDGYFLLWFPGNFSNCEDRNIIYA